MMESITAAELVKTMSRDSASHNSGFLLGYPHEHLLGLWRPGLPDLEWRLVGSLLLVVRPGAPSSVLAPSSDARSS